MSSKQQLKVPLVPNYKRGWKVEEYENDDVCQMFKHPGATNPMTFSELILPQASIKPHVDVDINGADLLVLMDGAAFEKVAVDIRLRWVNRLAAHFKVHRSEIAIASRHKIPTDEKPGKISFHMIVNTRRCQARVLGALMQTLSDLPGFDPNIYKLDKKRVFTCVDCYKPDGGHGSRQGLRMERETHLNCLRRHFVNYVDKDELEDAQDLTEAAAVACGASSGGPASSPEQGFCMTECSQELDAGPRVVAAYLGTIATSQNPVAKGLATRIVQTEQLSAAQSIFLQTLPGAVKVPNNVAAMLRTMGHVDNLGKTVIHIGKQPDRQACGLKWWGGQGVAIPEDCATCDDCGNTLVRLNDDFDEEPCQCVRFRRFYYFWIPARPLPQASVTADDTRLALEAQYFGGEAEFVRRLAAQPCKRPRVHSADDEHNG